MEKKLRRSFYITCFACLLTLSGLLGTAGIVKGQLLLQAERPVELHFDNYRGNGFSPEPASGQLNSSLWILDGTDAIPATDFNRNGRLDYEESTGGYSFFGRGTWNENRIASGLYALSLKTGDHALAILPGDRETSLTLRLKNASDTPLSSLQVSYDLLTRRQGQRDGSVKVHLLYSNDNRRFHEVEGADFSTANLSRKKEGWQLNAMSARLRKIVIPSNDHFYLKWVFDAGEGARSTDDIALDNIRLEAGRKVPGRSVLPGDLVITELGHAGGETARRSGVTDYIELYNRSNHAVDLNGMLISNGDQIHVIERDEPLWIAPYGFLVLERPFASAEGKSGFYISNSLPPLNSAGGTYFITDGSDTLARADYAIFTEDRTAFELNDVKAGAGGEVGKSDFKALSGGSGGFMASAGEAGTTALNYAYRLPDRSGWHLLAIPTSQSLISLEKLIEGKASVSQTLDAQKKVYALQADKEEGQGMHGTATFEPGGNLLFKTASSDARRSIDIAGEPATGNRELTLVNAGGSWKLGGNPYLKSLDLKEWSGWTGNGNLQSRVLQVWDDSSGAFVPSTVYRDQLPVWGSFVVQSSDLRRMTIPGSAVNGQYRSTGVERDQRFIAFHLSTAEGNPRSISDPGAVLFFNEEARNGWDPYDALKIEPFVKEDASGKYNAFIYFRGEKDGRPVALSQDSRPEQLQQRLSIDLVLQNYDLTGPMKLDWSELLDIPSDWNITLVDHVADREVDMQKQRYYRFNLRESKTLDRREAGDERPEIKTVQPENDRPRFSVVLEPAQQQAKETVSDQPNKVTLKQNYPNPFNPSTVISFDLPEKAYVRLGVFNVVGQKVASLVDGVQVKGNHKVTWDGSENPSGIYIYQLEVNGKVYTRKMTLIK